MTHPPENQLIHTRIWQELPEEDDPFVTRTARCRGYDVFGEMVGQATWFQMLWLLLRDELPPATSLQLFETLAVGLANPGPRDPSIHAAMCGAVGGSPAASSLMAALAVGAGRNGGAREVFDAMNAWASAGEDGKRWLDEVCLPHQHRAEIWPDREHPAGFIPTANCMASIHRQLLESLAKHPDSPRLNWLSRNLPLLEGTTRQPLGLTGIAAAAFADLGFSPQEGEMLFLLLRLPGAMAHSLEQNQTGHKTFPFFEIELISESENSDDQ